MIPLSNTKQNIYSENNCFCFFKKIRINHNRQHTFWTRLHKFKAKFKLQIWLNCTIVYIKSKWQFFFILSNFILQFRKKYIGHFFKRKIFHFQHFFIKNILYVVFLILFLFLSTWKNVSTQNARHIFGQQSLSTKYLSFAPFITACLGGMKNIAFWAWAALHT